MMYALLIHSIISLAVGAVGGVIVGFTLRARVWRLEHEQASFAHQGSEKSGGNRPLGRRKDQCVCPEGRRGPLTGQ